MIMRVRLASAVLVALGLAGCPASERAEPPTCVDRAALSPGDVRLRGTSLLPKQLALSFDDGPDARTGELASFLAAQGIRATFFVNDNAQQVGHMGVLAELAAEGHLVANHSKNHLDLTAQTPATIVAELTDVDTAIAPFVPAGRFLFRAPFGAWDANVSNALEASPMSKYVGHVDWDVGAHYVAGVSAADWSCWQDHDETSEACGELYRKEIAAVGRGIVLMHDALYTKPGNVHGGNTVDMVKYLVPLLVADGYSFVRVDEVPEIAAMLPPLPDAGSGEPRDAAAPPVDAGAPSAPGADASLPPPTPIADVEPPRDPCVR